MGDCTLYRRVTVCWICLTDDVAFGVAEVRGSRTAPLLNMTGIEEEILWYGAAYLFVPVQSCLCLTELLTGQHYINEVLQPVVLPFVQQHHVMLQDDNARPRRARIVQQFLQQNNMDHIDWPTGSHDLANRAYLVHSRPACTTESSTTKNAPSFGRSLAGGVEEDTPATDCQTHQEYASSCTL